MPEWLEIVLDVIEIAALLFGLFFMSVAALGVLRLPDFYHRMHASSKGVTLGISGMLIATGIELAQKPDANPLGILTAIVLVIAFQFIANPVGGHLLSKAAHIDRLKQWDGTLSDDLAEDQRR